MIEDPAANATSSESDSSQQRDTGSSRERGIGITRVGENHYRAVGANGATVEFGRGEGLMTPVELLLAALAGCSAIDVDTVTSRRTEPERFSVSASSNLVSEDGATRLTDIALEFDLAFPDDEAGRAAAGMVERLVQLSHDKHCTVSRTVEHATPVQISSQVETVSRQ